MARLDEYRKLLDEIDSQIIALYEQRMNIVRNVIDYKRENNIPILDSKRESLMLEKNLNKINNEIYKKYYPDVLNGFLLSSKHMQEDILKGEK